MPVGVEYDVTSCDLGVFVDQAAEIAGRGPARTTDEPPWLVGGRIDGEHWSVVVTYRAQRVRIISARRSRKEQVALPPQASLVARVAGDATANQRAAFWCTERGYAAPVSTDSRQRRFSTQLSTQTGCAAEGKSALRITWPPVPRCTIVHVASWHRLKQPRLASECTIVHMVRIDLGRVEARQSRQGRRRPGPIIHVASPPPGITFFLENSHRVPRRTCAAR
jgi:uncharacterized DUF497 family protein